MPLLDYIHERRYCLAKVAGTLGGTVLLAQHASQYLGDMRQSFMEERVASDNLRRRFAQNEQDASYMALGLLPTLADQILQGMDVEELTKELQSRSRSTPAPASPPLLPVPPLDPPLSESNDHIPQDHLHSPSDGSFVAGTAASAISYPSHGNTLSSSSSNDPPSRRSSADMSKSSSSWVKEFESTNGVNLGETSSSTTTSVTGDMTSSTSSSIASATNSNNTRSKADLWREVKLLTFTRTLTVMYSITLLTLFTHLQLSLLNRVKYVQSVLQLDAEEQEREESYVPAMQSKLSATLRHWLSDDSHIPIHDTRLAPILYQDTEVKYLTMSWWLLHVGWKDVGERVRRAVEEVLDEVSLKEQLSPRELHRLLIDIRRRIEHEVTFEGQEKRSNYLSALIPSTPETLQHVLTQAGLRVAPPPHLRLPPINISASGIPPSGTGSESNDPFMALLSETVKTIDSVNFSRVLEAAFDHISEEVMLSGLFSSVFGSKAMEDAVDDNAEPRMRLAAMLPGLTRWSRLALTGLPNELVDRLGELREVKALSAIIFSLYATP